MAPSSAPKIRVNALFPQMLKPKYGSLHWRLGPGKRGQKGENIP